MASWVARMPGSAMERNSPLVLHLQVQERAAPLGAVALAQDAVDRAAQVKGEFDLHLGLAQVDQFVVALGAGLAPQRPGHGVEQRRLAVAVGAGQAGQVDALKIEGGTLSR